MPSLVLIGPAVWPTIGNRQTDKQINKHIAFYMLDFGASLLKFILSEMYNYLINFQPVLFGVPLQLGALSVRLVRLWVNPALAVLSGFGK